MYQKRRDVLCHGLFSAGWLGGKTQGHDVCLGAHPGNHTAPLGSLEFSRKKLLTDAQVAVSPGIGFGSYGDEYVRFSLIENEHRTRQAIRSIREMFRNDKVVTNHKEQVS